MMRLNLTRLLSLVKDVNYYPKISIAVSMCLLIHLTANAKEYNLTSPDKHNQIKVSVESTISWSVIRNKDVLIKPSEMSLTLDNGKTIGVSPVVLKSAISSVNQVITAIVPVRNKLVPEVYNQLTLTMKDGYALEFRAYDDGVAYRFVTNLGDKPVKVYNEEVTFNFHENCQIYLPKESNPEFQSHYEGGFTPMNLSEMSPETYGYLPLYVSSNKGTKMVVTESDLSDYPNLFLFGTGGNTLIGRFPKSVLATKTIDNIHLDETIIRKADYHAKTIGNRTYPWRVIIISANDKDLVENELVYKLAKPNKVSNTKWIKPGKAAWDWWNANNIYGVDFKAGINTKTYQYYVDFAAEYGLEYIILDEGWSRSAKNVMAPNQQLNLEGLVKYASSKNVGVILWSLWKPLDNNMEEILDQFVKWGIKGVKVDFMARADQYVVNFYERIAKAAAKRKLLVDFHGAYKPVGLNREYPNVINYEGVKGLEQNKWDTAITPAHNVTLPFTRMVAGPMDYTPGAMLNSNKEEFHINFESPMSRGTRAHQTAMFVIYDAPLQMFSDSPSNYRKEPEYTRYISRIPTTWDRTIALEGKIGEYVVTARKNGDKWFIGGMTDWKSRSFKIPLTFLDGKRYKLEILKDGINVGLHAADYQLISRDIEVGEALNIDMAAGGGYTAILTRLQ